jgi:hypothetical protein
MILKNECLGAIWFEKDYGHAPIGIGGLVGHARGGHRIHGRGSTLRVGGDPKFIIIIIIKNI